MSLGLEKVLLTSPAGLCDAEAEASFLLTPLGTMRVLPSPQTTHYCHAPARTHCHPSLAVMSVHAC